MYLRRMVSQTLGLGLMVPLVILALSACDGGGSAHEEQATKVHHIPEDSQTHEGKPLPAGHYVTEEFRPTMSFDLDTGWTRGGNSELRGSWDIRDIDNEAYWLGFLNAGWVFKPDRSVGMKVARAPEDMVAWVQTNPFLKTEKSTQVSVGGEKGAQIDALVADVPRKHAWCSPNVTICPDIGLFYVPGAYFFVSIKERSFAAS
jgi:hypothetical protein